MKRVVTFILIISLFITIPGCKSKQKEEPKQDTIDIVEEPTIEEEPVIEEIEIKPTLNIKEVTNINSKFTITTEVDMEIEEYIINVYDSNNKSIYESTTKETTNTITLKNLKNNNNYTIKVSAKLNNKIYESTNSYTFTWKQSYINEKATVYPDNNSYTIKFGGDIKSDNYKIKVLDGDQIIIEEVLNNNTYTISSNYYKDQNKTLTVYLLRNDEIINDMKIINEINPITDLIVTSPTKEIVPYNDVEISVTGGENATEHIFNIYRGKVLVDSTTTKYNRVGVPKSLLSPSTTYKAEIIYTDGHFTKKKTITFKTESIPQAKSVYISNNYSNLKYGSKVTLSSDNDNAKIYYTIDGTEPTTESLLYTEPLVIDYNQTIKAIAVQEGYTNSITSVFNVKIKEKEKLVVYLSPSNQYSNKGVSEVGYTNERDEMNDLSNYIQERLEYYGVKVYRNNPDDNMATWLEQSKINNSDLHLAIHSNASGFHNDYGVETWIDNTTSKTFSLASMIQKNLVSIYPYKDEERGNKGVRFSHGSLGEANDEKGTNSILVEVAHHDYKKDAEWIMNNKKEIGYNIADSVLRYYQIID